MCMIISSLLQKGIYHLNHNEDELVVCNLSKRFAIAAVMDGCSAAINSHLAAGFIKILVKREVRTLSEGPNLIHVYPASAIGERLMKNVFIGVNELQGSLSLTEMELMTTFSLLVLDVETKQYWAGFSGDGLLVVDEKVVNIDQNNRPNFLAYHLERNPSEWFDYHVISYSGSVANHVVISTDGVWKLKRLDDKLFADPFKEEGLLKDLREIDTSKALEKRYKNIRTHLGYVPFDDLAIVCLKLS